MVLKYINVVVTHNLKNYEFSSSKIEISKESLPISDSAIQHDFCNGVKLINSVLNNMINAKVYSSMSNAKQALRINNLSADINIIYTSDLEKSRSYHPNLTTVRYKNKYNDDVSSIRYSYSYGDSCIYEYMRYGNPICEQEYESEKTIEFNIKNTSQYLKQGEMI